MNTEMSLSQLTADVLTTLRTWQKPDEETVPLQYLLRAKQLMQEDGVNAHKAVSQILLDGLDTLTVDHANQALIIHQRFLDGAPVHALANRLNIGEATVYRKQSRAIENLARILLAEEMSLREKRRTVWRSRLESPTYAQLTGVDIYLKRLTDTLTVAGPPWIISVEGMGGLGKTALADAWCRQTIDADIFGELAWISARQTALLPGIGVQETDKPTLTADELLNALLRQLDDRADLSQSFEVRKMILSDRLKDIAFLIVIDNLETAADIQELLPLLRDLVNPGKFLLTSRFSLRAHTDVHCLSLSELSFDLARDFIRSEAEIRGISDLADASDETLADIYDVTGGNPLALKLIIGQTSMLSLSQIIDNLKAARGKHADDLYTYIYWQAWNLLDDAGRRLLLSMPLVQNGTLAQLAAVTELEADALASAMEQLITLSLMSVGGDLNERRYTIHRLTETFLLEKALKWST